MGRRRQRLPGLQCYGLNVEQQGASLGSVGPATSALPLEPQLRWQAVGSSEGGVGSGGEIIACFCIAKYSCFSLKNKVEVLKTDNELRLLLNESCLGSFRL